MGAASGHLKVTAPAVECYLEETPTRRHLEFSGWHGARTAVCNR